MQVLGVSLSIICMYAIVWFVSEPPCVYINMHIHFICLFTCTVILYTVIIILISDLSLCESVTERSTEAIRTALKSFSFTALFDLDVIPGSPLTAQRRH